MNANLGSRRTQGERREHTRQALIDATYQTIRDAGYRAATTRQIADRAGVSLGALAHHFPTRTTLISATLDEVAQRSLSDLRAKLLAVKEHARDRHKRVLDLLWEFFGGELFTVWVRVWLAATEDAELRIALADVEDRVSDLLLAIANDVAPSGVPHRLWARRFGMALDTLRGAALTKMLAPGQRWEVDRWPSTRAELLRAFEA